MVSERKKIPWIDEDVNLCTLMRNFHPAKNFMMFIVYYVLVQPYNITHLISS